MIFSLTILTFLALIEYTATTLERSLTWLIYAFSVSATLCIIETSVHHFKQLFIKSKDEKKETN
jgi:hypothetical protein